MDYPGGPRVASEYTSRLKGNHSWGIIICMSWIAFFYELVVLQEMLRRLQPQLLAIPPLHRR
jgi:hypothetical protein